MSASSIVTLTDRNFSEQVLTSPVPVLVDFWAEWCGPCKMIAPILDELAQEYEGKVRLYFKHLPLKSIHPWAESAALVVECARQQSADGSWKMYHAIFKAQRDLTADNLKDKTTQFAKDAGLDGSKYVECYDAKAGLPQVDKDLQEAGARARR